MDSNFIGVGSQYFLRSVSGYDISLCQLLTDVMDISDDCNNGRNISTYLTSGMGDSDAFVILVAKAEEVNCTVNFLVNKGNHIMLVIEFLDWVFGTHRCGNALNTVNVMVSKTTRVNICTANFAGITKSHIFRSVGEESISVAVSAENELDCIKITATSVRDSFGKQCNEYETKCPYENQIFCMTREVRCDGNINCGVRDAFDEDKNYCGRYHSITPAMVIVGSGIGFVSFTLLVALLRNLLPKRKGTFIFKEDETLSDKDRATSQRDFKVKLRILNDSDEMTNTDTIGLEEDQGPAFHQKISFRKTKPFSRKD